MAAGAHAGFSFGTGAPHRGAHAALEASPRSSPPARRPQKDDFDILAHLGEGSVGSVHKVRHKRSLNVYALKHIEKARVVEHKLEGQLLNEIKTQMTILHPNLLRCLEYFEDEDGVFLVLEFVSGGDLYRHMKKKGPFSEPDAAHVFAQIAEGLKHLHDNGVIHRDLKPENILLDADLVVKIADFGWCAMAGRRTTFCGTLCILAPEMVVGDAYDARIDIWALGVILYEMLAGKSPFDRGQGLMETCKNILQGGLEDSQLEQIPPDAHSLLAGLLAKSPERRMGILTALANPWVATQTAARSKALLVTKRESPVGSKAARTVNKGIIEEQVEPPRESPQDIGKDSIEEAVPRVASAGGWDIPSTSELLVEKLRPAGAAAGRSPVAHPAAGGAVDQLSESQRRLLPAALSQYGAGMPPTAEEVKRVRGQQLSGDTAALGSAQRRPPDERARPPSRFSPVPEDAASSPRSAPKDWTRAGSTASTSVGSPEGLDSSGFFDIPEDSVASGSRAAGVPSAKARTATQPRAMMAGVPATRQRLPALEEDDAAHHGAMPQPILEDTLSRSRADWQPFIPKTRQRLHELDQDESFNDFVPMSPADSAPAGMGGVARAAPPGAPAQDWQAMSSTWSGRVADLLPPTSADVGRVAAGAATTGRVADLLPPTNADMAVVHQVTGPGRPPLLQASPQPPPQPRPPRAGFAGGVPGGAFAGGGDAVSKSCWDGADLRGPRQPAPPRRSAGAGGLSGIAEGLAGPEWLNDTLRRVGLGGGGDLLSRSAPSHDASYSQTVEQICQLGFTRQQATEALKRTSTVEAAVEWIIANS